MRPVQELKPGDSGSQGPNLSDWFRYRQCLMQGSISLKNKKDPWVFLKKNLLELQFFRWVSTNWDLSNRKNGLSLKSFANETASEIPAPGGGSVAAYAAALGTSLGTMVANLSAHKKGWDERWEEFSKWAEKGQAYKVELLKLVDEDSNAFDEVMDARKLPKETQSDFEARVAAINKATMKAIEIPYKVMKISLEAMKLIKYSAEQGLSSSISDAGVGALMANAAVKGAYFNVRINCKTLENPGYVGKILKDASSLAEKAAQLENEILEIVEKKLA